MAFHGDHNNVRENIQLRSIKWKSNTNAKAENIFQLHWYNQAYLYAANRALDQLSIRRTAPVLCLLLCAWVYISKGRPSRHIS
jgi:hypothetical protein